MPVQVQNRDNRHQRPFTKEHCEISRFVHKLNVPRRKVMNALKVIGCDAVKLEAFLKK